MSFVNNPETQRASTTSMNAIDSSQEFATFDQLSAAVFPSTTSSFAGCFGNGCSKPVNGVKPICADCWCKKGKLFSITPENAPMYIASVSTIRAFHLMGKTAFQHKGEDNSARDLWNRRFDDCFNKLPLSLANLENDVWLRGVANYLREQPANNAIIRTDSNLLKEFTAKFDALASSAETQARARQNSSRNIGSQPDQSQAFATSQPAEVTSLPPHDFLTPSAASAATMEFAQFSPTPASDLSPRSHYSYQQQSPGAPSAPYSQLGTPWGATGNHTNSFDIGPVTAVPLVNDLWDAVGCQHGYPPQMQPQAVPQLNSLADGYYNSTASPVSPPMYHSGSQVILQPNQHYDFAPVDTSQFSNIAQMAGYYQGYISPSQDAYPPRVQSKSNVQLASDDDHPGYPGSQFIPFADSSHAMTPSYLKSTVRGHQVEQKEDSLTEAALWEEGDGGNADS